MHRERSVIQCFGVAIEITGPSEVAAALLADLPFATIGHAGEISPATRFEVRRRGDRLQPLGFEAWTEDGRLVARARRPEVVAEKLANVLHFEIASNSDEFVFVHAGVVGWERRAIVLPGRSMSGKSTLVRALLAAGATYYSDEYAVFGRDGAIHPYSRRLRLRTPDGTTTRSPEDFTDKIGNAPIKAGMIASLRHDPNVDGLDIRTVGDGAGALLLVDNTVRARELPGATLRTAAVAASTVSFVGTRGEAAESAERLLALASESFVGL